MILVGIDIGGTFTDLVFWAEGEMSSVKVPSTPHDFCEGFLQALDEIGHQGAIDEIVHSTTVATNALLERKGARCGMITTAGFRDVLELRRADRRGMFGLEARFDPLIPRELRLEVPERSAPEGTEEYINQEAVGAAVEALRARDVEAVVVGFLHATAHPENEQRAADKVREAWPEVIVVSSSEASDEATEFERFSTAAASAYVTPLVQGYLDGLVARLGERGCGDRLRVVTSDGGVVMPDRVLTRPIRTALSGPAAGVMGARHLCALAGYKSFVTCDMGGTSFDACLVRDGVPALTRQRSLGFGFPLAIEMLDIATIGAGGGSIVRPNDIGGVDVGPEGLGADPGPACYGKQSHRAGVTDANVVLGRLGDALHLPRGVRKLDSSVSLRTLDERVARPLKVDVWEAALTVVETVDKMMAEEIRSLGLEKRVPLDEAVLVAYGGAGPLHAAGIARDLGVTTVLVPPRAGLFSAWGGLLASPRETLSELLRLNLDAAGICALKSRIACLRSSVVGTLAERDVSVGVEVDVAYRGQAAVVPIHLSKEPDADALVAAFIERAGLPGLETDLEIRGIRVSATPGRGRIIENVMPQPDGEDRPPEEREVSFNDGGRVACAIVDRDGLAEGSTHDGPMIIEERGATTLVPPGATVCVAPYGLRITLGDE